MDGWMDGWMDGSVGGRTDGMDGWAGGGRTDGQAEIDFKVIMGTATISLCAGGTQS